MQETSIYLDYIVNPAKASVGNFIHAISDPFSYAGSFNTLGVTITNFSQNLQILTEEASLNSLYTNFSSKFLQLTEIDNIFSYYNNTNLHFFLSNKLIGNHAFFVDFAHVVYHKNNYIYIDHFVNSYESQDILNELDSLITEADLEAEAQ
jgi:hypothetical protein